MKTFRAIVEEAWSNHRAEFEKRLDIPVPEPVWEDPSEKGVWCADNDSDIRDAIQGRTALAWLRSKDGISRDDLDDWDTALWQAANVARLMTGMDREEWSATVEAHRIAYHQRMREEADEFFSELRDDIENDEAPSHDTIAAINRYFGNEEANDD